MDVLKRYLHHGQMPSMYYFRTRDGLEIDLFIEESEKLHLLEIKSSSTITPKHASSLEKMLIDFPRLVKTASLLSNSHQSFLLKKGIANYNWETAFGF